MAAETLSLPYGARETWVGDWRITPVFDGYAVDDPTQMYLLHENAVQLGEKAEDWLPHQDLLNSDGLLEHGLGGFLLRRGEWVVLVDCGIGPNQLGPYGVANKVIKGGEMLRRLADIRVAPDEITDVVFTHLHPDHYGWAIEDNGQLFPNATMRCHVLDWEHFVVKANPAALSRWSGGLPALEGRLETWDKDETILSGIDTVHAPGHTPGSTLIAVSSGHDRALLLGDVVHCPVELVDTDWALLGDLDPELAMRSRIALARELESSGVTAAGAHFPGMNFGRLLQGDGRRRWVV